jgi:TonB family protein
VESLVRLAGQMFGKATNQALGTANFVVVSNFGVKNRFTTALLCAVMLSLIVFGQQKSDGGVRLHCKLLAGAHAAKIVRPTYPELARQTHVEGRVSLACVIGRDGTVQKIEVKKGHPLLVQAATDAVAQWKLSPSCWMDRLLSSKRQ